MFARVRVSMKRRVFLIFCRRRVHRPVIRHGCSSDENSSRRNLFQNRRMHLLGGIRSDYLNVIVEVPTVVAPATTVTLAPRRLAASAIANPIRPEELFVRKRTGSMTSRVAPTVISRHARLQDPA